MATKRKFLLASTVSLLLLFTFSQNSQATIYEWNDFTKPFTKQLNVTVPITVEVDLPDFIFKNYREIPLVFEHSGLGFNISSGIRRSGTLTINEQGRSQRYRFGHKQYSDEPIRLLIKTKELKTGLNKLHFRKTSPHSWGANYGIYKMYFDLPDIEKIRTVSSKSPSPSEIDHKKPKSQSPKVQKDIAPPKIVITSHDISRGIRPIQNQKKVRISGKAYDENGIVEITINNKDATFDEEGNFETDIYLKMGENQIVVSAMDVYENRANKEFTITRVASKTPSKAKIVKATAGKYFALVIGNDNYKYLRKLTTAKKDAEQVGTILKHRYGFDIKLLLDVTRNDIVRALNRFRKKLREDDSFLIYYAGHGEFDKVTNKAYWLPVDARSDEDTNWIIVDTITSNIKRIPSRHILIIADSCYSGTFTRRAVTELVSDQKRGRYLNKMQAKRSRMLLASGGNEPVSDIGGKGHSVFAKALLRGLAGIDHKEFTAEELYYQYIKEMVAGSSEQTPEYNIIRNSGHEGGDFVFRKKLASVEQEKSWEDEKIKITLDKMEIADDYPADIRKIVHPDKKLPKPKSGYKYAFCLITMNKIKNVHLVNLEDSILISEERNNYKSIMSVTTGINFMKYSLRYVVTEGAKIVYVFLIPQHAKPDKLSFVYYFKNQLKDSSIEKGKIEIQL